MDIRNILDKFDVVESEPQIGDVIELECGDTLIETVITEITDEGIGIHLDETALRIMIDGKKKIMEGSFDDAEPYGKPNRSKDSLYKTEISSARAKGHHDAADDMQSDLERRSSTMTYQEFKDKVDSLHDKLMNTKDKAERKKLIDEINALHDSAKKGLLPEGEESGGMMDPRDALHQVRNITRGIKYDDTASNIISEVKQLADKTSGINMRMLEMAENDVFEAMRALESAVYALDEIFEDAARQAEYDEEDNEEDDDDEENVREAKYQGREVSLGKPFLTPDGPKKRSVYVKNKKGNVVKVNFGQKGVKIKKNNPNRRKSFRARHNCSTAKDRTTARYWSCKFW